LAESQNVEARFPDRNAADIAVAVAAGVGASLWLLPFFYYNQLGGDEGIAFQGAVRILNGELPYHDFFSFYTPGCYFLYAALFKIFGTSIEVARFLLLIYGALFSAVSYLLARRVTGRIAAVWVAALVALMSLPSRFQNLHSWDSTATSLLTIYAAVLAFERRSNRWALICGLFAGATLMIDQARGGGVLLGLTIATYLVIWRPASPERRSVVLAMVAGCGIPITATIAYFAAHGALFEMFTGWLWPVRHYTAVNRMPFGFIYWSHAIPDVYASLGGTARAVFVLIIGGMMVGSVLPLLVMALTTQQAINVVRRRAEPSPLQVLTLTVGLITLGTFVAIWITGRRDFMRVTYIAPLFMPLLPLLLDKRFVELPSLAKLRHLLAAGLIGVMFLYSLFMMSFALSAKNVIHSRRGEVRVDNPPDEVIAYVQGHTTTGERVMVYPYASLYLFLTGTMSPTRFDFLQPGMHPASDFEIARQQLERDRTKVVVFDLTFASLVPEFWPATPPEAIVHDAVADFILQNYRSCKVLKGPGKDRPFLYMVRKDLECPK
jgi:hypothetical protein